MIMVTMVSRIQIIHNRILQIKNHLTNTTVIQATVIQINNHNNTISLLTKIQIIIAHRKFSNNKTQHLNILLRHNKTLHQVIQNPRRVLQLIQEAITKVHRQIVQETAVKVLLLLQEANHHSRKILNN